MTARREAVEGKLIRARGMGADGRAALTAYNARQTDWHGWCQVCRTHVTGAIAALHVCPKCGAGAGAHG